MKWIRLAEQSTEALIVGVLVVGLVIVLIGKAVNG